MPTAADNSRQHTVADQQGNEPAGSRRQQVTARHGFCKAETSPAWNDRRVSLENVLRVNADGRGHATLCSIEPNGRPVREVVPVQWLGDASMEVAGSPGLVMGCAAGDVLRLEADGQFIIEERGPYECVQAYANPPFSQEAVDTLCHAAVGDPRRIVAIGFSLIHSANYPSNAAEGQKANSSLSSSAPTAAISTAA